MIGGAAAGALLGGLVGNSVDRNEAAARAYQAPQPAPYYQQGYAQPAYPQGYQQPSAPPPAYVEPQSWVEPPRYQY